MQHAIWSAGVMTTSHLPSSVAVTHSDRVARRRRARRVRAGRLIAVASILVVLTATVVILGRAALATFAPDAAPVSDGVSLNPFSLGSEPDASDGVIDDGDPASPFDETLPAISGLDPALLTATQAAAVDAEADGITLFITSGWRSERYQEWLYDDALSRYGSAEAADEFVATGGSSTHLSGDAIDVGQTDAAYWMVENSARYGLCQIYANEVWHYELAVDATGVCPTPYADASDRPKG